MELSLQPFYERESVRIYCGDSYDLMPEIPEGSAGLVLTDPQYNIGFDYGPGIDDQLPSIVYEVRSMSWWDNALTIASTVVFTPGQTNLKMWYRYTNPAWVLAWYKGNSSSQSPVGGSQWEPVLVYGEVENRHYPDIFHAPIDYEETGYFHPTPKPLDWARELLKRFYTADTLVVDPFMGSATVLAVCLEYGIPAIGIEQCEKFCEGAARRLEEIEIFGDGHDV